MEINEANVDSCVGFAKSMPGAGGGGSKKSKRKARSGSSEDDSPRPNRKTPANGQKAGEQDEEDDEKKQYKKEFARLLVNDVKQKNPNSYTTKALKPKIIHASMHARQ